MSFLFDNATDSTESGIIYGNTSDIKAKISEFIEKTSNLLHVVLDFDRTLTEKNNQDSTSWQLMRNHLPADGQVEAQKLFDHYRALEVAEKLTPEDATIWWASSMAIVAKYRLNMGVVERDFLSRSTIRPGTKELFALCASHNIPTVIMSAGIKDVIDIWCKTYDIHPTIILSTELMVDENNCVTGWKDESVVHMFNKHELDHPELSKIRAERPYSILVGDSLHDHNMAEGTNTVLRFRVVDDDGVSDNDHEATFALFDAVINSGTLYPVVNVIEQTIPSKNF